MFKTASVIPDGLFGLAFADGTASYFMLEIDRGTMPVVRKGTNRTSFARKLHVYYEGWKQKRHEEQLGIRPYLFDAKTGALQWKFETGKLTEAELGNGFSRFDIKAPFAYDPTFFQNFDAL